MNNSLSAMDILYFLGNFPKLSESFILNEIYGLVNRGHTVSVFALNDPNEEVHHDELAEIDLTVGYASNSGHTQIQDLPEIAKWCLTNPGIVLDGNPPTAGDRLWIPHISKQCIEFIEDNGLAPDLIHGHFATKDKLAASHVGAYYSIPLSITAHANDIFEKDTEQTLSSLLGRVDNIITISEYNREYLRTQYGYDKRIEVLPAPIRIEKFEPTNGAVENRLLTICRLIEKKGVPYAIKAIDRVTERHPTVEYHIIGTGPRQTEIEELIERYDLEDNVSLLGTVDDETLINELDEASGFVLPCVIADDGDRDGIPVVLKEAVAMATPVISTRVSGIPELIEHGHDGLLVPQRDVDELASAIDTLLQEPHVGEEFGEQARRKMMVQYKSDRIVGELESVFSSIIQGSS